MSHDSQYTNLVAFDGTESDMYEVHGDIVSGLHVESDVLNGAHGSSKPATISWAGIGPLAGLSLYGFESAADGGPAGPSEFDLTMA